MKFKLLLSVAIYFLTKICLAQVETGKGSSPALKGLTADSSYIIDRKFSFGWSIGNSYPKGDFGNITPSKLPLSRYTGGDTSHINGYAQPGFHYDIYVAYEVIPYIYLMLSLYGDKNDYAINILNSEYVEYFPPYTVSVNTADKYSIVQYMIGPKVNLPFSDNFSVEFNVLAGICYASNPALTYTSMKDTVIYSFPSGRGFGFNVGAGVKYSLDVEGNLGLGLHLNINYEGAEMKYPNYTVTEFSPPNFFSSYIYNVPKSMSIGIIQLTFGATLEL
jgi:hypothetical protein